MEKKHELIYIKCIYNEKQIDYGFPIESNVQFILMRFKTLFKVHGNHAIKINNRFVESDEYIKNLCFSSETKNIKSMTVTLVSKIQKSTDEKTHLNKNQMPSFFTKDHIFQDSYRADLNKKCFDILSNSDNEMDILKSELLKNINLVFPEKTNKRLKKMSKKLKVIRSLITKIKVSNPQNNNYIHINKENCRPKHFKHNLKKFRAKSHKKKN